MTELKRPVRRETLDSYRGRPIVVELTREGVRVKEKGRRTWFGPYTYRQLFARLAQLEGDRIIRERKAARKAKKGR